MFLSKLSVFPASVLLVLVARARAQFEAPRFVDLKSVYTLGETYNITWEPDDGIETNLWVYSASETWTQIGNTTTEPFIEWNLKERDFISGLWYYIILDQWNQAGVRLYAEIEFVGKEEESTVETSLVDVSTIWESSTASLRTITVARETSSSASGNPNMTSTTMETSSTGGSVTSSTATSTTESTATPTETLVKEANEKKEGMSNGAKAGIGVGTVAGFGLLAAGGFFLVTFLRRGRWGLVPGKEKDGGDEPELVGMAM
ncbi:hypothetical protein P154DRAFT_614937 [Amniculicola lignicola CBS 123094]|uniref:Mid2 domain-containing protein n=1 Tax=Amniculicola lignicola CBS 123094 TaxID=1392246 RepID=A0A6A5X2A4_9PLEO|nr:hypothetical protein P154DRAFT_614937 [Amniculicola lignicola CBS 123094]